MPSVWVQHIKDFAAANNLSYGCALSDPECSRTYREKYPKKAKNPPRKKNALAPPPVITPVPTPPPPPVRLVAAEPTGNPKLMQKGIEIKRPMSEFDFKEIEPPKSKGKRILKKAPPKQALKESTPPKSTPPKSASPKSGSPPSRTETLDTLIQMVADDSPDLPADIKKIKKLYNTYFEIAVSPEFKRNSIYGRDNLLKDIRQKLFVDYGLGEIVKRPDPKGVARFDHYNFVGNDDPLLGFISTLQSSRYTDPMPILTKRFEAIKEKALTFRDMPHIPYLIGVMKYILDTMKDVPTDGKTIGIYLDQTYGLDEAYKIRSGLIRIPDEKPETVKGQKKPRLTSEEEMRRMIQFSKSAKDKTEEFELKAKKAKNEKDREKYEAKAAEFDTKYKEYERRLKVRRDRLGKTEFFE